MLFLAYPTLIQDRVTKGWTLKLSFSLKMKLISLTGFTFV